MIITQRVEGKKIATKFTFLGIRRLIVTQRVGGKQIVTKFTFLPNPRGFPFTQAHHEKNTFIDGGPLTHSLFLFDIHTEKLTFLVRELNSRVLFYSPARTLKKTRSSMEARSHTHSRCLKLELK